MKPDVPAAAARSSRWLAMASLASAVFMVTLDSSIVNVALAPIAADFRIQVDSLEWIVIAYTLTLVALLPIAGRMSDRLGRARTFSWGQVVFVGGSLLCSLAWDLPSLVVFRVIQGMGAAMLQGNSHALVTVIFPQGERGRAFGIMAMAVSSGIITGPVVGGLLTGWLGWRSIFWVNAPIGLISQLLIRANLPKDRVSEGAGFDYLGSVVFGVGIIALMSGLSGAAHAPWFSLSVGGAMAAGAALLVAFVRVERTAKEALIPPIILQSPGVAAGMAAAYLSFAGGFAATFLSPYVMQKALGYSPQTTGLVMIAVPLGMILFAPISGYLSDRFGPRLFTLAGLLSSAAGLWLLSSATADWQPRDFFWRLFFQGVGWGLFNSPNTSTIMSAVPQYLTGVTGGLTATIRNAANTTAVALAATLFTWALAEATSPEAHLFAYRTTLTLVFPVALAGLIPALLREVPPRATGLSSSPAPH